MKAWDIVGYTYNTETWCPDCMGRVFDPNGVDITETILDEMAKRIGINRQDEYSFDSSEFPKVIFASSVESDEYCDNCQNKLID